MAEHRATNILVTGASGYVGSRLVLKLARSEGNVRSLVRDSRAISSRFPDFKIDVREGDLLEPGSLKGHFNNIDVAFYLVHSLSSGEDFNDKELECARNFMTAAKEAGVGRIIYLGGLAAPTNTLSRHLSSRRQVGEVLKSSNIPCIEFQASIIIGSGGLSFEIIKSLVKRLPVMVTPKWVSSLAQPIWIDDVISYLYEASQLLFQDNIMVQIGGPDKLSYKELMREYGRQSGYRRVMISVPVLTPRLSSLWLGLVTPAYARAGRKLIDSLTADSVITDSSGMKVFKVEPISYKEAISKEIESENHPRVASRWFDAVSSGTIKNSTYNTEQKTFRYRFKDSRQIVLDLPVGQAFEPINQIGGPNGWYYANFLWRIRSWIDLALGGVGMRRSRMTRNRFLIGDTLDWWRISEFREGAMVEFKAEMKLPGEATLRFEVQKTGMTTTVSQVAQFSTNSVLGCIYWYGLYPLHSLIFAGMLSAIGRKAMRNTGR